MYLLQASLANLLNSLSQWLSSLYLVSEGFPEWDQHSEPKSSTDLFHLSLCGKLNSEYLVSYIKLLQLGKPFNLTYPNLNFFHNWKMYSQVKQYLQLYS